MYSERGASIIIAAHDSTEDIYKREPELQKLHGVGKNSNRFWPDPTQRYVWPKRKFSVMRGLQKHIHISMFLETFHVILTLTNV